MVLPLLAIVLFTLLSAPGSLLAESPDQRSSPSSSVISSDWRPSTSTTSAYRLDVQPTFYATPLKPASVRDFAMELDRPRTEGLLASTTWLNGMLSTETEVATNQGGSGGIQTAVQRPNDDVSTRMMRLGVTGTTGTLRYGMRYRQAGAAFYNAPDQSVRELWSEWKQGFLAMTSAVGQQWNNVAADPARPRLEHQYGRIGLAWSQPAWPNVSVTFSHRAVTSLRDPAGVGPQKTSQQTVEAGLAYGRDVWQTRFASTFGFERDLTGAGADKRFTNHTLTAAFRPSNTLAILPTLGYREEQQEWSGVRTDSPSASLAMNYQQSKRVWISTVGGVSETRSSDHLTDLETVSGKGTVAFNVPTARHWATLLALEAGYNRQFNRVAPSAPSEELSGILRLVLGQL